jgi:23S rRNA (guanosine2251-2'-O)-methyltransferase
MAPMAYLYGIAPVQQCLLHDNRTCYELLVKQSESKTPRLKEVIALAGKKKIPVKPVDPQTLGRLANSKLHQGVVLGCSELKTRTLDDFLESATAFSRQLLIALDQVEDPQNVGAIIRSAAFLGASGLITLKDHAAPLSVTVSKASAGALEYFPIIEVTNLSETLQRLKKEGYQVVGATLGEESIPFHKVPKTDWMVLVLGNEGQGLRRLTEKRCDLLIHIPGKKQTESLNVNAAAAILIQYLVDPA